MNLCASRIKEDTHNENVNYEISLEIDHWNIEFQCLELWNVWNLKESQKTVYHTFRDKGDDTKRMWKRTAQYFKHVIQRKIPVNNIQNWLQLNKHFNRIRNGDCEENFLMVSAGRKYRMGDIFCRRLLDGRDLMEENTEDGKTEKKNQIQTISIYIKD